jgi:hypothetical protein
MDKFKLEMLFKYHSQLIELAAYQGNQDLKDRLTKVEEEIEKLLYKN